MRRRTKDFCERYVREGEKGGASKTDLEALAKKYADLVEREIELQTVFPIYHEALPEQHAFGMQLFRPLIDFENSKVLGISNLSKMSEGLKRGENVILVANHQTEPDPQAILLLLEDQFSDISEKMIFIAGDRVVRDPMAIPLSLGCNILSIYSKKYIDTPPERREDKLLHNKRTLGKMEDLLRVGGKIIYVAPSGGRDRKGVDGNLTPAPFNPESVELLYLIAKRSGSKTAFHTLALKTYDLLPPPSTLNIDLGEERLPGRTPVSLFFGDELDLEVKEGTRHEIREIRAKRAYEQLLNDYFALDG